MFYLYFVFYFLLLFLSNTNEIRRLSEENQLQKRVNGQIYQDVQKLTEEKNTLKATVDGIENYLRVNNIEISGLAKPLEPNRDDGEEAVGETVEEMLINCLNELNPDEKITPLDIDFCHELPSRNGSINHVIKFKSRKTKLNILAAKKRLTNHNFKFRDNTIFVNEHLGPYQKHLFSLAKQIKTAKLYKYLWTRNGKIFMRKDDRTEVIPIISEASLNDL